MNKILLYVALRTFKFSYKSEESYYFDLIRTIFMLFREMSNFVNVGFSAEDISAT